MQTLVISLCILSVGFIIGWYVFFKLMAPPTSDETGDPVSCPHGHLDWDDCPDCGH